MDQVVDRISRITQRQISKVGLGACATRFARSPGEGCRASGAGARNCAAIEIEIAGASETLATKQDMLILRHDEAILGQTALSLGIAISL